MELTQMEMRHVYGETLCELMEADPRVLCLEADLSKASGTNPMVAGRHPDNFINCGVCEANMISIGAGLSAEGKIPFCASFTCFASRRVYDQITISVAYAGLNVKIVGTAPGITAGPNGGTHMCFQDLGIMRIMPNMHVYSPCDPFELRSMMKQMASSSQPAYMQLIRPKVEPVFDSETGFQPGKAHVILEGEDVALISTGYTTHLAAAAARELATKGIQVQLIHCPSIKPLDEEAIIAAAKRCGAVVTVENQNIMGGLGGAVCEVICEHYPVPVKRLGAQDQFGEVATEDYLLNKHRFNIQHIMEACEAMAGKVHA
jgi:transketolase